MAVHNWWHTYIIHVLYPQCWYLMSMKILWISTMASILVLAAMQVQVLFEIVSLFGLLQQNVITTTYNNIVLYCWENNPTQIFFVQQWGFIIAIYLTSFPILVYYREVNSKWYTAERVDGSLWRNSHGGTAEQRVNILWGELPRAPCCLYLCWPIIIGLSY